MTTAQTTAIVLGVIFVAAWYLFCAYAFTKWVIPLI